MKPTEIALCREHLEKLLEEQRYEEARMALADYSSALERSLEAVPPGDPRLAQLALEAGQLMDAARRRVLIGRAHLAARLAALPRLQPCYRPPAAPRRTWQVFG